MLEYKLKRRTYLCASIDNVVVKIYRLLDPIVTLTSIHLLFPSIFFIVSPVIGLNVVSLEKHSMHIVGPFRVPCNILLSRSVQCEMARAWSLISS